jgi:hypothetical protein
MKKSLFLFLMTAVLFISGLSAQTPSPRVDVIYFHATRRCATCNAIEQNTKKTLETYFPGQLKSGVIRFNVINVDEEKNKAMAEKYEAAGSALFLTRVEGGKETRNDESELAFSYARSNPDKFMKELRTKINALLKP